MPTTTLTLITPPFVSPVRSLLRALDSLCPNGPCHSTWTSPNHSKPSTTQTKPIMLSLPQTSLDYWIPPSPHSAFSFSNQKHRVIANTSLPRLSVNKCVFFRRLHLPLLCLDDCCGLQAANLSSRIHYPYSCRSDHFPTSNGFPLPTE